MRFQEMVTIVFNATGEIIDSHEHAMNYSSLSDFHRIRQYMELQFKDSYVDHILVVVAKDSQFTLISYEEALIKLEPLFLSEVG